MVSARGLIAVDKKGGKVLFLNPITCETEVVIDGLLKNVHELLVVPETSRAYVPIFGDGIHGRNPNRSTCFACSISRNACFLRLSTYGMHRADTLKQGLDGMHIGDTPRW